MPTDTLPQNVSPRQALSGIVKQLGLRYWRCLYRVGIPRTEARQIAVAIAKFDAAGRSPSHEQRQLILRYSPLICRAELWRRQLLG